MILASILAASKAGIGSIEKEENLLWAQNLRPNNASFEMLKIVDNYFKASGELLKNGIYQTTNFSIVAVPTILIEHPVSLVGLGDTISSVSLIGAGKF